MADDEGTVGEGGAAGGEPLGEDPQVATVADVHRNPDDDDYPLDIIVYMYTSAYQAGNDCFCFRKEEETRAEACGVFKWQGLHQKASTRAGHGKSYTCHHSTNRWRCVPVTRLTLPT